MKEAGRCGALAFQSRDQMFPPVVALRPLLFLVDVLAAGLTRFCMALKSRIAGTTGLFTFFSPKPRMGLSSSGGGLFDERP